MQRAIALLGGTILESNCLNRHPTFHSSITPAAISQVRTKIEIAAPDGNINRALKRLTDIVQADRLHDAWRRAQVFKRPGVIVQEERMKAIQRHRKKQFTDKIKWVLHRKSRGF